MTEQMMKERIKRIRLEMHRWNFDTIILNRPVDVSYVTAFAGEDSWAVVTKRSVYLVTDSRYTEQARKECLRTTIVERTGLMSEAIVQLVKKLKSPGTIAVDKSISLTAYETLRKRLRPAPKTVDGLVAGVRTVKDTTEISAIKTAISISTRALEKTRSHFKAGVTENELAGILELEIRRLGGRNCFETIVAFGPNASRPHHKPTQRRLKSRDTILIDFGAGFRGYCSDITRCFAVGRPTSAYRKAYAVVEQAQAVAIQTATAGAELAAVDAAARRVIRQSGLPVYGHGSGHGFGLEIHESPFLKEQAKGTLRSGQVLTIEPGIYIPGKFGVRIEDDILITNSGRQVLTRQCPHTALGH